MAIFRRLHPGAAKVLAVPLGGTAAAAAVTAALDGPFR
jgi:hypothetical protein